MKAFTLEDAIGLATWGHRHQTDKAGLPYIQHPLRVLASVQAQGAMPYVQMGAVLHDLTEDQPFTPQMLLDLGVPEAAVTIVTLLDRDYSLGVWKFLDPIGPVNKAMADEFYYKQIAAHPGAKQVKLADIHDNLQEWRLSYLPEETQIRLKAKYAKAKELLK